MTTDIQSAKALESLRSGVPGEAAVQTLGTTQHVISKKFGDAIDAVSSDQGATPLVISAGFGEGKSHLFKHLRAEAERLGYVTSMVTVSPEMPLGNAHVVLKAIAENATAPGRTGKAVMELAKASNVPRSAIADLRKWAREAEISDRFKAQFHIYDQTKDEELQVDILGDIEGRPVIKTRLAAALKDVGAASQYDLRAPKNALLAHERLRILAQFFRVHGAKGLIVFFDEVERIEKFTFRARLAAYEQMGWWKSVCEQPGSAIYAVLAQTPGSIEQCLTEKGDEAKVGMASNSAADELAREGIALLRQFDRLEEVTAEQLETLQHGVRDLYHRAYGIAPEALLARKTRTSVRSEIRRWITIWDLQRHDPTYKPNVTESDIFRDTQEVGDEDLAVADDE